MKRGVSAYKVRMTYTHSVRTRVKRTHAVAAVAAPAGSSIEVPKAVSNLKFNFEPNHLFLKRGPTALDYIA
jgi:hypothetical protein